MEEFNNMKRNGLLKTKDRKACQKGCGNRCRGCGCGSVCNRLYLSDPGAGAGGFVNLWSAESSDRNRTSF